MRFKEGERVVCINDDSTVGAGKLSKVKKGFDYIVQHQGPHGYVKLVGHTSEMQPERFRLALPTDNRTAREEFSVATDLLKKHRVKLFLRGENRGKEELLNLLFPQTERQKLESQLDEINRKLEALDDE